MIVMQDLGAHTVPRAAPRLHERFFLCTEPGNSTNTLWFDRNGETTHSHFS